MRNTFLIILITVLINFSSNSQSKIEKAEKSIAKKERSSDNSESKRGIGKNNNSSDTHFLADAAGGFLVEVFAYTIYGIAIESPFELEHQASSAKLSKYPYYDLKKENYTYEWDENTPVFRSLLTTRYISENRTLKGLHINLDMRFLKRLGIEADYLQLWEKNQNFGNDNLGLYTILAKYHRVRTEKFNAYWGLGTTYIDGNVNQFGFTYGLGTELFFVKPMSVEANFNQTFINEETVNKFNALLNYHNKQYKINGGYEHLRIGTQNFSTLSLGLGFFF